MAAYGILSWGGYVPRLRLERAAIAEANGWASPGAKARAKGRRSMLNWDEDSVTMAVEAGRACLTGRREQTGSLTFASTTPPFAERPASVLVAEALSLPDTTFCQDAGLSVRSATSALVSMLKAPSSENRLLVAADMKPAKPGSAQEFAYGAGSAAVLVGEGDALATLEGAASISTDFVSHYRSPDRKFEYHWEERWVRDEGVLKIVPRAVAAALADTGAKAGDVARVIFPSTFRGIERSLSRALGISADKFANTFAEEMGDSGAAHPILVLGEVLEKAAPGDLIVIAAFGYGCDAIVLRASEHVASFEPLKTLSEILDAGESEKSYQKFLAFNGTIPMEWGVRAEFEIKTALTQQYRYHRDASGFLAGKCVQCGTIQFPRTEVCVNKNCDHVGAQEPVSLKDEPAKIASFTADWLSFKEAPPFCFGLVQFENGARALMEFADFTKDKLSVGAPVEFVYRKKEIDHERAYHSYFWKAAPAR